MNAIEAIGVISGVASIAGFIYAIYYARRSRRAKLLVYKPTAALPLATAVSPEEDYKLSITFQRAQAAEERIDSAHVRFVRFANLGKEPIRRADIAPANPLRIVVEGVRVLDIAVSNASRPVIGLALDKISLDAARSEAEISFDFLDHYDGGVIKILTVEGKGSVRIRGDIIGMPLGIKRSDEVRSFGLLNKVGCFLGVFFQVSSLVLTPFVYRWVTGAWDHWWLLLLPLFAFFVPGLLIAIVAGVLWPSEELRFPSNLTLPEWFRRHVRRGVVYSTGSPYHLVWDDENDRRAIPHGEP